MSNAHNASDLAQYQILPLEAKIRMSEERLKVWFEAWKRFEIYNTKTKKTRYITFDTRDYREPELKENEYINSVFPGSVFVSFSGGKDSTVLADLAARVCKRHGYTLYLLFVNTGLEYPEIQKFVKTFAEWLKNTYEIEVVLDIVRPEMRFDEVIKKYGYPVISKSVSNTVSGAKKSIEKGEYSLRLRLLGVTADEYGGLKVDSKYDYEKAAANSMFEIKNWRFLIDAPFNSSDECCGIMKKKPAKEYAKRTGRMPILGTMAGESLLRKKEWLKNGCNAFNKNNPSSQPLSFWTLQDILHYLKAFNIPYCPVYGDIVIEMPFDKTIPEEQMNVFDLIGEYEPEDILFTTGCDRTGCIFCMFGCHLEKEPNRFQQLKQTHPQQYEYCINGGEMVDGKLQPNKEGLGIGKVLDYIGVKYE